MNSRGLTIVALALCIGAATAQQYCPVGFKGPTTSGKCYRIIPGATSPLDANKVCQDNGGSIGTIKDQVEQDFVNTYVLPDAQDWLITGLVRIPAATGAWTWPDGSSAGGFGVTTPYSNWASPSSNTAFSQLNNYMYLTSYPAAKGTANYGKWWADTVVAHEVLCEVFVRSNGNGNCGPAQIPNNPCSCSRY